MKVESKDITVTTKTRTELTVREIDGLVVIEGTCSNGERWSKRVQPDESVALWRCLMGDKTSATVSAIGTSPHGDDNKFYIVWEDKKDGKDETWELCDGEALAFLNADQAMVLGWSIKKCAADALTKIRQEAKEVLLSSVWVLSCKIMLVGDRSADGVDLIGGYERVFSSEMKALDALREFLRPLVNDANTEDHWSNSEDDVDKEIDRIIDNQKTVAKNETLWTYEGNNQVFEALLCERRVDVC